jgi:hypothetical protein
MIIVAITGLIPLLFKCWKHNFMWIDTIFKDWSEMSIKSGIVRRSIKMIISYGVKQVTRFMDICEKDYDNDLRAMIRDVKYGNLKIDQPLPIRILKPILR